MKRTIIPIGIGILIGTLIGVLTNNIGLWLAIGIAISAASQYELKKRQK